MNVPVYKPIRWFLDSRHLEAPSKTSSQSLVSLFTVSVTPPTSGPQQEAHLLQRTYMMRTETGSGTRQKRQLLFQFHAPLIVRESISLKNRILVFKIF